MTRAILTIFLAIAFLLGAATTCEAEERAADGPAHAAEQTPAEVRPTSGPKPASGKSPVSEPAPAGSTLGAVSASSRPNSEGDKTTKRFGLDLSSDEPLDLNGRSFEMLDDGKGGETMRLRGDVQLKQGELELRCDRLDAFYPEGRDKGWQKVVASGAVQVVKGEFELRCTRATFEEANCIAVCSSSESCQSSKWPEQPARFRRGKDWIEGRELEFNQCTGKLFSPCGTRMQITPKAKKASDEAVSDKAARPAAAQPAAAKP